MVYRYKEILFSHKVNELLTYATTWMNLKNITLSEKLRHKSLHSIEFHSYVISKIGKSIETDSRLMISIDLGEGEIGTNCLMSIKFSFGVLRLLRTG